MTQSHWRPHLCTDHLVALPYAATSACLPVGIPTKSNCKQYPKKSTWPRRKCLKHYVRVAIDELERDEANKAALRFFCVGSVQRQRPPSKPPDQPPLPPRFTLPPFFSKGVLKEVHREEKQTENFLLFFLVHPVASATKKKGDQ
jgi:hypothetical protein